MACLHIRRTLTMTLIGGAVAAGVAGAALLGSGGAATAGAGPTPNATLHSVTQDSTTGLTPTIAVAPPCPLTITHHSPGIAGA